MADKKSDLGELISTALEIVINKFLDAWWEINPIQILINCIEKEKWFEGVVLSTAFFEGIGKMLLSDHFKGEIGSERFRNLGLIIMFLRASEIIDPTTYSDMMKVKDFRDDIVHLEPFTKPKLQPKKAKEIIEKAISCLGKLFEKWPSEEPEPLEELP